MYGEVSQSRPSCRYFKFFGFPKKWLMLFCEGSVIPLTAYCATGRSLPAITESGIQAGLTTHARFERIIFCSLIIVA